MSIDVIINSRDIPLSCIIHRIIGISTLFLRHGRYFNVIHIKKMVVYRVSVELLNYCLVKLNCQLVLMSISDGNFKWFHFRMNLSAAVSVIT